MVIKAVKSQLAIAFIWRGTTVSRIHFSNTKNLRLVRGLGYLSCVTHKLAKINKALLKKMVAEAKGPLIEVLGRGQDVLPIKMFEGEIDCILSQQLCYPNTLLSEFSIIQPVVGGEILLIGSAGSRFHRLCITHRNKHKASSLTSWVKGESPETQVLLELIYARILQSSYPLSQLHLHLLF